jgi:hypothetical protein
MIQRHPTPLFFIIDRSCSPSNYKGKARRATHGLFFSVRGLLRPDVRGPVSAANPTSAGEIATVTRTIPGTSPRKVATVFSHGAA